MKKTTEIRIAIAKECKMQCSEAHTRKQTSDKNNNILVLILLIFFRFRF